MEDLFRISVKESTGIEHGSCPQSRIFFPGIIGFPVGFQNIGCGDGIFIGLLQFYPVIVPGGGIRLFSRRGEGIFFRGESPICRKRGNAVFLQGGIFFISGREGDLLLPHHAEGKKEKEKESCLPGGRTESGALPLPFPHKEEKKEEKESRPQRILGKFIILYSFPLFPLFLFQIADPAVEDGKSRICGSRAHIDPFALCGKGAQSLFIQTAVHRFPGDIPQSLIVACLIFYADKSGEGGFTDTGDQKGDPPLSRLFQDPGSGPLQFIAISNKENGAGGAFRPLECLQSRADRLFYIGPPQGDGVCGKLLNGITQSHPVQRKGTL